MKTIIPFIISIFLLLPQIKAQNITIEANLGITSNILKIDGQIVNASKRNPAYSIGSRTGIKVLYKLNKSIYMGWSGTHDKVKIDDIVSNITYSDYNHVKSTIERLKINKSRIINTLLVGHNFKEISNGTAFYIELGGVSIYNYAQDYEGIKTNTQYLNYAEEDNYISKTDLATIEFGTSHSFGLNMGTGLKINKQKIYYDLGINYIIEQGATPGIKTKFKPAFQSFSFHIGLGYKFNSKKDKNEI